MSGLRTDLLAIGCIVGGAAAGVGATALFAELADRGEARALEDAPAMVGVHEDAPAVECAVTVRAAPRVVISMNGKTAPVVVTPNVSVRGLHAEGCAEGRHNEVIHFRMHDGRHQAEEARARAGEVRIRMDEARARVEQSRERMEQNRARLERSRERLQEMRERMEREFDRTEDHANEARFEFQIVRSSEIEKAIEAAQARLQELEIQLETAGDEARADLEKVRADLERELRALQGRRMVIRRRGNGV